jgi:hypothetical protein
MPHQSISSTSFRDIGNGTTVARFRCFFGDNGSQGKEIEPSPPIGFKRRDIDVSADRWGI